jgi:hypothetical protein
MLVDFSNPWILLPGVITPLTYPLYLCIKVDFSNPLILLLG